MGFGYEIIWDVAIRGTLEDLKRIYNVVNNVIEKWDIYWENIQDKLEYWDKTNWYKFIGNNINMAIASTLISKKDGELFVVRLENDDDDSSHDIFEDFLISIKKSIPQLELAARGVYVDVEYGKYNRVNYFYVPSGKSEIGDLSALNMSISTKNKLPKLDWIPKDLYKRHRSIPKKMT